MIIENMDQMNFQAVKDLRTKHYVSHLNFSGKERRDQKGSKSQKQTSHMNDILVQQHTNYQRAH